MAVRKPAEIFMSFDADEKMLEDIRRSVSDAIFDLNLGTKEKNSILLAIEEACTNVIRHAYLYGPGTIRLKIRIFPTKVVFSIYDKGRRFDFSRMETPDLDRYIKTGRKGGLGLYLIRKMMDTVDYYSRDGENELRMSKNFITQKQLLRPRGASIRLKFALWASLVVFVIVGAISYYIANRHSMGIRQNYFTEALNFAQTTALNASDKLITGNELELAGLARSALSGNPNLKYVTIVDSEGRIWADISSRNILSLYKLPEPLNPSMVGVFQPYASKEYGQIYHLITEIDLKGRKQGDIHFGFSQESLRSQLAESRRAILLLASLGLLAGLGAVYLLSYYFVKPIQRLTEGVLKIGRGNLEETLPVEGTDEFSEIARAFNEITGKFKQAQENIVEQERLQKEMQVAQEIQHALLPSRFPEIDGYELAAVYRAAKDVGGDYFDFVWIDKDTLGIAVADVSGKGVPGSLVMTMIRTAIRLEARGNKSPSDILARVNSFVAEDVKKGMFITMFFIILDSKNRRISFASAGHNPMILFRKDTDKCYFLNPKGMPLGLALPDDISFGGTLKADSLKLKKDDMLVIYTDGITEAMNNRSDQYGNDRLINFIKGHAHLSPDEFATELDKDLAQFTSNAPQNDDITLVVIKEQIMADELYLEKRKRLIAMVEEEGIPIEDACKSMGVSPTTFYRYRKRWKELGDAGLLNRKLRAEEEIRQVSYHARKALLETIRQNPEFGAARLQKKLLETGEEYSVRNVYDELVSLRLNTRRQRLAYVERVGQLKPEQKLLLEKEMLREERKELDRQEYVEDLSRSIERRQVQQLTHETGKVISQLRQLAPAAGKKNLYGEIAKELEKLEDGHELAEMFRSVVARMGPGLEEADLTILKEPPAAVPRPTMEPIEIVQSSEAIDIKKKAIKKGGGEAIFDDIDEYEKKLLKKYEK